MRTITTFHIFLILSLFNITPSFSKTEARSFRKIAAESKFIVIGSVSNVLKTNYKNYLRYKITIDLHANIKGDLSSRNLSFIFDIPKQDANYKKILKQGDICVFFFYRETNKSEDGDVVLHSQGSWAIFSYY